jgi:hypothetical protein
MTILNENPVHIIADEGMILTDGVSYSTEVWLGKYDSPEYWREVPEDYVPDEQPDPDKELAEAARILLGL